MLMENIFFPEVETLTKGIFIRKLRRAYRSMFYRANNDHIQFPHSSLKKNKKYTRSI